MRNKTIHGTILFSLGILIFFLSTVCCSNLRNAEAGGSKAFLQINKEASETFQVGDPIICVMTTEREMKPTGDHLKYTVTIQGTVAQTALPDLHITVRSVSVANLRKVNGAWIKDRTVVKKPPYTIGKTYLFRSRQTHFDNAVSTGFHTTGFTRP